MTAGLPRYASCRVYGHHWVPYTVEHDRKARLWRVTLVCAGCPTRRMQRLNETGHVIGYSYRYAEGYLTPPGAARPDRDEARMVLLASLADADASVTPIRGRSRAS